MSQKTIMEQQIIEVIPYDRKWPVYYEQEIELIKPIFSENFLKAHHIGSTAVPNLAAKPTIDILIEVKDIFSVDQLNPQLQAQGYAALGDYAIKGRRLFIKGKEKRTHHIHVFQSDNQEIIRHLYFRDYLIAHSDIAKEYGELKTQLAEKYHNDRQAYLSGKDQYVKELEKKAIAWFKNKNS